jgi:hypothetical protein
VNTQAEHRLSPAGRPEQAESLGRVLCRVTGPPPPPPQDKKKRGAQLSFCRFLFPYSHGQISMLSSPPCHRRRATCPPPRSHFWTRYLKPRRPRATLCCPFCTNGRLKVSHRPFGKRIYTNTEHSLTEMSPHPSPPNATPSCPFCTNGRLKVSYRPCTNGCEEGTLTHSTQPHPSAASPPHATPSTPFYTIERLRVRGRPFLTSTSSKLPMPFLAPAPCAPSPPPVNAFFSILHEQTIEGPQSPL